MEVTQGNPLPPTIFNVVVDALVCHWGSLVVELYRGDISGDKEDVAQTTGVMIWNGYDGQRRAEEEHQRLMVRAELLYANERMVASTDPGWLQSAFDALTGIFERVGLRNFFCKTMGIVCSPCRGAGRRGLHPEDDRGG